MYITDTYMNVLYVFNNDILFDFSSKMLYSFFLFFFFLFFDMFFSWVPFHWSCSPNCFPGIICFKTRNLQHDVFDTCASFFCWFKYLWKISGSLLLNSLYIKVLTSNRYSSYTLSKLYSLSAGPGNFLALALRVKK